MDFFRIEVHILIFSTSVVGRDVSWFQYRVVPIVYYFGNEPDSGYY